MTTENIALQAWRKDISYILHAVQGESDSRTFNFILYDQTGAVISLAGKTVAFYVQKPDGNIVMLATTTSGSTISVTLTLQACAVPGVMPCWIQLVDENGNDLRVDSLLLEVQACDFDEAVESSSEFTALQEALGDVAKFNGHLTDYSNPHQVTAEQANAVPIERTVNGKPLSADITLNATDVGALPSTEKGQPNGLATLDAEGNLVQSHAAGFKLSVAQGGTGASDPVNARSNLGMGELLSESAYESVHASYGYLSSFSFWQSGMSTFEFLTAMPDFSYVKVVGNPDANFSDAPCEYCQYELLKGSANYKAGWAHMVSSTPANSLFHYCAGAGTEGFWGKVSVTKV